MADKLESPIRVYFIRTYSDYARVKRWARPIRRWLCRARLFLAKRRDIFADGPIKDPVTLVGPLQCRTCYMFAGIDFGMQVRAEERSELLGGKEKWREGGGE